MGSRPGPADAGANQLQPLSAAVEMAVSALATTGARTRQEPKTSEPAAQYEKVSAAPSRLGGRRKMYTAYKSIVVAATGPAEREKLTHAPCLTVLSIIGIIIICIKACSLSFHR